MVAIFHLYGLPLESNFESKIDAQKKAIDEAQKNFPTIYEGAIIAQKKATLKEKPAEIWWKRMTSWNVMKEEMVGWWDELNKWAYM